MRTVKLDLLFCISKVIEKYGKNYSFATNALYLEHLDKFHQVKISMRTLLYHMKTLRDQGYIKSIRRYGHNPDGTIYRRSSAVCLTVKGYLRLAKQGWTWAVKMANKLGKRFIPKWKPLFCGTKKQTAAAIEERLQFCRELGTGDLRTLEPPQKPESALFDQQVKEARAAGVSLYDYLLKRPQPLK